MSLSEPDLRIVWVRAGGHCVICKKYLMEGEITGRVYPLGEGAHIVGQSDSARSPRGQDPLPLDERDSPDNALLACPSCHLEIDNLRNAGLIDTPFLRRLKEEHEAEIRRLSGLVTSAKSAVLRMVGDIRGRPSNLTRDEAVLAVIRSGRIPDFPGAYDGASEAIGTV